MEHKYALDVVGIIDQLLGIRDRKFGLALDGGVINNSTLNAGSSWAFEFGDDMLC